MTVSGERPFPCAHEDKPLGFCCCQGHWDRFPVELPRIGIPRKLSGAGWPIFLEVGLSTLACLVLRLKFLKIVSDELLGKKSSLMAAGIKIGRASCRERVCQYV